MGKEVFEYIRFRINSFDDRQNVVIAFANSGYKVWVVEEKPGVFSADYYVCVEKPHA